MPRTKIFSIILLLTLATTGAGCQLLSGAKLAAIPTADAEHPVVEIICVWQPGEGTGMDGLPARGFAGQILFFAMGEKSSVRVDGKVRVYVFDDQGTPEEQEVPIHQFDFDAKAFQSFLTQTNMGAAYQLFIPYTRKGSHNAACTLRVRYTPDDGGSVYSKMATINLPGTTPRKPEQSIEQVTAGATPEAKIISDLLLAAGQESASAGHDIILASATQEASSAPASTSSTNEEGKRRLRNTLTEISSIQRAPPPQEPATSPPSSFRFHPLDEQSSATVGHQSGTSTEALSPTPRHPLLED